MMQKSDNTAAFLLANYVIGLNTIQQYVDGWGMTQTDMVNNTTSNHDMALLFEKIMNNKITHSCNVGGNARISERQRF